MGASLIQEHVDKISSAYLNNTSLRALVSGIPYLGGSIDTLLAGRAAKVQYQRILQWLEEIRATCAKLDEQKIDKYFLRSDEFEAVFYETVDKVRRTREAEKRTLFRNLLINACLQDSPRLSDKEYLAKKLDDLTLLHVQVLRLARQQQKPYAHAGQIVDSFGRERMYEVAVAINDLARHGLVYIAQGNPLHKPLQAAFHTTAFGQDFLRFLEEPT